ncbi:30S ribosomal protein S20 [Candidatus Sumerlaeota bacterium]|nr:30S ribosomal protein S20 [Candidatus Sumerlaeota bacterium]
MPNKESSRKRVRQNERRNVRNRAARSEMRSAVKEVGASISAKKSADDLKKVVSAAQSKLGKASKRKLIKKNKAARLQSRLMKAANKASKTAQ